MVYQAIDLRTKKNVALKLMNIPGGKDDSSSHMFLREIYNHSRLTHGGIVKLIDFGYHDYLCFMALEYLEGKTLKEVLQESVFSQALLTKVTLAVVEVLAYFDSQDLVHRDIKPSNIILTASDKVKIIDFGLCKGQYDYTVSSKENINGTPQFVSPEQILGDVNLDIKSDIYSLGATLYYLLTGVFPFKGDSLVATLSKHLTGSAARLDEFREDLPQEICSVIHSMMSKEKKKRPKVREIKDVFVKYSNAIEEKTS